MKKRILLLGALVGAFLLASCSGGNKKQVVSSALLKSWTTPVK